MLAFFITAIIALSFKLFKPELERNRRATVSVPSAHSPAGRRTDGRVDADTRISDRQLMIA
jgi:hypothetical protein